MNKVILDRSVNSLQSINNVFDLYSTVSNRSINNEIISKRRISSYDILIVVFLSFSLLIMILCIIKAFVRRYQKQEQNDVRFIKKPTLNLNQNDKKLKRKSNQTSSIQ